jgi:hypothetical protein
MLGFSRPSKKETETFDPEEAALRLAELNPASALVDLHPESGEGQGAKLGKSFFLKRGKQLYRDGAGFYLTTPDALKAEHQPLLQGGKAAVLLQFLHRQSPVKIECLVVGHFQLLPEVAEALDFKVKAAYKLRPLSPLNREERRKHLRFAVKNYGDSRIPLTSYVHFDVYLKSTEGQFPREGVPPAELADLKPVPLGSAASRTAEARSAADQFRALMQEKPVPDRVVFMAKPAKKDLRQLHSGAEELLQLGQVNVLGLERDLQRNILYVEKSAKADLANKDNPYNLHPGERVVLYFAAKGYWQLRCEVVETQIQNDLLRPVGPLMGEEGLKLDLVDYSVSGLQVEGLPALLKGLLGSTLPEEAKEGMGYEGPRWERAFEALKRPMLHLNLYPRLRFPEELAQFQPNLPFKIPFIVQLVQTSVRERSGKRLLHHGLRLVYDLQAPALDPGELERWKLIRGARDNPYFNEISNKLNQLRGHLEYQGARQGRG